MRCCREIQPSLAWFGLAGEKVLATKQPDIETQTLMLEARVWFRTELLPDHCIKETRCPALRFGFAFSEKTSLL